jgi:hypothetical protein
VTVRGSRSGAETSRPPTRSLVESAPPGLRRHVREHHASTLELLGRYYLSYYRPHRFRTVNVEWEGDEGSRFLSVHARPAYVEDADGVVHYGSLVSLAPAASPSPPLDLDRMVWLKTQAMDARWTVEGHLTGYHKFPPGENRRARGQWRATPAGCRRPAAG